MIPKVFRLINRWTDVFTEWGRAGDSQVVSECSGVMQRTGIAYTQLLASEIFFLLTTKVIFQKMLSLKQYF